VALAFTAVPAIAEVTAPRELSAADIASYRRVFALQDQALWREADREIGMIQNKLLMGHVLFQRYMHPTSYRSTFAELKGWLDLYADHPEAQRVYDLAVKRRTAGSAAPKAPTRPSLEGITVGTATATQAPFVAPRYQPAGRSAANAARVRTAIATVRDQIRRGDMKNAHDNLLKGVTGTGVMDATERDILQAEVAAGYFTNRNPAMALKLAEEVAQRNRRWAPRADWIAGLAAWELGQYEKARGHFEIAAQSRGLDGRDRAAAAYWVARVNLATRRPQDVILWLEQAAAESHSLYGVLAARQLGQSVAFDWETPAISAADMQGMLKLPSIRRAIALTQVGNDYAADREIRMLYDHAGLRLAEPLLAVAAEFRMAAAELRIGRDLLTRTGMSYTGSLYPVPQWNGYEVDPALVLALVRQESAFNTRAKSVDGAQGLMQLMPGTAGFIANDRSLRTANRARLFEPDLNLALGQKYVTYLLESGDVRGNLLLAVAAYNGGPGNLSRWLKAMGPLTDPLLFIEKIPVTETREFTERVLANFWIYRARLGQGSPTLDALAAGHWPIYETAESIRTAATRSTTRPDGRN
jgi:soluble lytic murein transglycosylase-like protein